jgi:hypothetical protein
VLVSEANKTSMNQFFERVYNQGDIAFLDQLTSPEFVSHDRGNPTHDREGVKEIVGAIKAAFPDARFAESFPRARRQTDTACRAVPPSQDNTSCGQSTTERD